MSRIFDRSAFKQKAGNGVKLISDKNRSKINSKNGDFPNYVKMKDNGTYLFRILPAPNPEDPIFYTESKVFLPIEVVNNDGKKEIKQKPVFTADYHAKDKVKQDNDVIWLYIDYVNKLAQSRGLEDDELEAFIKPVKGSFSDFKNFPGIIPSPKTICYVKAKEGELEALPLSPYAFSQIESLNTFTDEDGDIYPNVLTDIDEGMRLKIVKQFKGDSKKVEYIYSVDEINARKGETLEAYWGKHKISDEDFEKLSKVKSLKERFVDVYSKRDYMLALNGLENFDKKYYSGEIFEDKGFQEEVAKISALYVDEEEGRKDGADIQGEFDKVSKKKQPVTKKVEKPVEEEEEELTDEQAELARLLADDED